MTRYVWQQRSEAAASDRPQAPRQAREARSSGFASPQTAALNAMAQSLNDGARVQSLQRIAQGLNERPQVQALQRIAASLAGRPTASTAPRESGRQAGGRTALPETLKTGLESLSGLAMDDVRVHHNSAKPAQFQALAYAQGSEIHLASGAERHLPHEAWHVVQQKQGRVPPTIQAKGVPVNDDPALEREADVMGEKAMRDSSLEPPAGPGLGTKSPAGAAVAQRVIRGLEGIRRWQDIDGAWVDAYIADVTHPHAHLYDEDIASYLDQHAAGWRNDVALAHEGNHWDLQIDKHNGTVIQVSTVSDGNCGAYAIHAVMNRATINADTARYDAPGGFVAGVRNWIQAHLPDRNEIRKRIFQEIRNQDYSALTGFGPQLMAFVAAREVQANISGNSGSNSSSSDVSAYTGGQRYATVMKDKVETYLYDGAADESFSIPEEQWQNLRPGMHVTYELTGEGRAQVTGLDADDSIATRIQSIVARLGLLTQEALSGIETRPKKATEITAADIILSFCVEFEGLTAELRTLPQDVIASNVFQPEIWSACYATAARLFALLRAGGDEENYHSGRLVQSAFTIEEADKNAEEIKRRDVQMDDILRQLIADIGGARVARIYNCGFGIHGFCFILRNQRVELLQSFANGLKYELPAITVAESIRLNKSFATDKMIAILRQMGGNESEREAAQRALFETTIETGQHPFPLCEFYWEGANLLPDEDIDRALTLRISKNMLIMRQMLAILGKRLARMKQVHAILGAK